MTHLHTTAIPQRPHAQILFLLAQCAEPSLRDFIMYQHKGNAPVTSMDGLHDVGALEACTIDKLVVEDINKTCLPRDVT